MTDALAVYIANSPLHVLYARALVRMAPGKQHDLHWFGKPAARSQQWYEVLTERLNVSDFSELGMNEFGGFVRSRGTYLQSVPEGQTIAPLYTCHTHHLAFEALRRAAGVAWRDVGGIEDGIGSYYPWRMLPLRRQLVRSGLSVILARQALSVARRDLGGDPRLGRLATLAPDLVHLHPRSRAEIVDISASVRAILDELALSPPAAYEGADALLFLPPVLSTGRLDARGLADYVRGIHAHDLVGSAATVVVKPHPRDAPESVGSALASLSPRVRIAGDEPVELYMGRISPRLWLGSPTTAMLNNRLLFSERETRYALFPIAGNPYVRTQVDVLRKVLGPALVHVAPTFAPAGA